MQHMQGQALPGRPGVTICGGSTLCNAKPSGRTIGETPSPPPPSPPPDPNPPKWLSRKVEPPKMTAVPSALNSGACSPRL